MGHQFAWDVLWQYRGLLIDGLWNTLFLFVCATATSFALACVVGVCGAAPNRLLRGLAEIYVELNRNTPLVVKLFFLYFGAGLGEFEAALLGLTLHQSAYKAEVIRSGIQSIRKGQMEAGLSTGFSRIAVMRRIIMPQALVVVIPPLTTQVMETLKNTSVAMTISIQELTFETQQIETTTFRGFEAATATTVIYLLLILVIAVVANTIEARLLRRSGGLGQAAAPIDLAATASV